MFEDRFDPPARFETASDQLHELVTKEVGSSDFGGDEYKWGLRVLLQSMDYDPQFSPVGRRVAWGLVINALSGRAHATRALKQMPKLPAINRPVVITGVPRTGTTALHKLLAVDPQFQGLQGWLINSPMPRPPRNTWEQHPLFQLAVDQLSKRFAATPDLRAAHNMVAEEVDECLGILSQCFVSNMWSCGWSAATYDAWWQTQTERPAYHYLKRTLQLIGSPEPEKRWLLKNPGHVANLDLLFEVFPDALVIQTHRDPAKAIPSLCKILIQSFDLMETGRRDQRARIQGIRETEKWAKHMRDTMKVRESHPDQVIDVVHGDFHANPLAVIKRIYAFIGAELRPDVEAAMKQRIVDKPELSHGVHRYDISEFGLTEGEIRERFGSYVDHFGLLKGARS